MRFMLRAGRSGAKIIVCPFHFSGFGPEKCQFEEPSKECWEDEGNDKTEKDCPLVGCDDVITLTRIRDRVREDPSC